MPAYLTLWNWTETGIKDFRQTTARVEQIKADFEKLGVTLDVRWTVGPYDMVSIAEAPDDESLTAYLLEVCSGGNIRTTTLRAYDRETMTDILGRLG